MDTEAHSLARSYQFDPELAAAIPERPALIPGAFSTPFDADSLLMFGGNRRVLLRGKSARGQLPTILSALDGSKSIAEVASALQIEQEIVYSAVCLLYSEGLVLEPGPPTRDPLALFASRTVGFTRQHSNGIDALNRARSTRLVLLCEPAVRDQALPELTSTGFGDVQWHAPAAEPTAAGQADVALVVAGDRDDAALDRWMMHFWSSGTSAFMVRLGVRTSVGPLIIPQRSACWRCIAQQGSPDEGAARESESQGSSLALAVHRFVVTWLQLGHNDYHNNIGTLEKGNLRRRNIVRLPECSVCGPGTKPPASNDERAMLRTYFRTELCSKEFLSPSHHMGHYSAKNVEHTHSKVEVEARGLSYPFTSEGMLERFGQIHWLTKLAELIELGFGYRPAEDGNFRMRFVPSGGALDSPTPYLALKGCGFLPDGIYRYSAGTHTLDSMPSFDLGRSLLPAADGPAAILYVLADHDRISVKYKASATRICCLDAGVSLMNFVTIARALGIASHMSADLDGAFILGELNMSRAEPTVMFPTYAAAFGEQPQLPAAVLAHTGIPLDPVLYEVTLQPAGHGKSLRLAASDARDEFQLNAIRSRRTSRTFDDAPLDRETLTLLIERVAGLLRDLPLSAFAQGCSAIVTRGGEGLPAGAYQWTLADPEPRLVTDITLTPREFLNQTSLSQAPLLCFPTADLLGGIRAGGYGGYRDAMISAGAHGGALWLASTELGLAGCIAGGVIENAVRVACGDNGFDSCAMLAYVVGYRQQVEY